MCDACGVARHYLDDPPLDLPYTPRFSQLPSFWLAIMWSVASLLGAFALLSPEVRAVVPPEVAFIELAVSGMAAVSSFFTAHWERLFNEVTLNTPPHAQAGSTVHAELKLVPYQTIENVTVKVNFKDHYYEGAGTQAEAKVQELASTAALTRARLPGRRATTVSVGFMAPFPASKHTNVNAEMMADVLDVLGFLVPTLKFNAANMREHGGYYVEARVRVGLLSRKYRRRVITYHLGGSVHVG